MFEQTVVTQENIADQLGNLSKFPPQNYSTGRILATVAMAKDLNINIDEEITRILINSVKRGVRRDTVAAYRTLKCVLKEINGIELPKNPTNFIEDKRVNHFKTEAEYLMYLAHIATDEILDTVPNVTANRIIKARKGKGLLLKQGNKRKINLYSFQPSQFGLEGLISSIRGKPIESCVKKKLSNISSIFVTRYESLVKHTDEYFSDKNRLNKFVKTHNFSPYIDLDSLQTAYTIIAKEKIIDMMKYNGDIKSYLENDNNWIGLNTLRKKINSIFLIDAGGFHYVGNNNEETKKFLDTTIKLKSDKIIQYGFEDNFTKGEKDLAVSIPFRGDNDGEYFEGRISPANAMYIGTFGGYDKNGNEIIAHPIYHTKKTKQFLNNMITLKSGPQYVNMTTSINSLGYKSIEDLL